MAKRIGFKSDAELDEFNRRKAVILESYHLRNLYIDDLVDREEYLRLCDTCGDNYENEEWPEFEEMTMLLASEEKA